jgi:outer membrane protein assembly factor BamB
MPADQRLRDHERQLLTHPQDAAGWLRLSLDYERLGRVDDAVHAAASALRLDGPKAWARLEQLGAAEGPWPSEGADTRHSRRSPLHGPDPEVAQRRFPIPSHPLGTPLLDARGRAFLRVRPTGLVRIDTERGDVVELAGWPVEVSPLLLGGRPVAFDPALHTLRPPPPDAPAERTLWPALRTPHGLYALADRAVTALDGHGIVRWRHTLSGPVSQLVTSANGPLLGLQRGRQAALFALDPDQGKPLWRVPLETLGHTTFAALATGRDGSLVTQVGSRLVCLDTKGRERWRREGWSGLTPALDDGRVLTACPRRGLACLDLSTGRERWTRPEISTTKPLAIDGRGIAYVAGLRGRVWGLTADGRTHLDLPLAGPRPLGGPAIGHHQTLVLTAGRTLVVIG